MPLHKNRTADEKKSDEAKSTYGEGEDFVVECWRRGKKFADIIDAYNDNFPNFPIDRPKLAAMLRGIRKNGPVVRTRLKTKFVAASKEGCVWVYGRPGKKDAGFCDERLAAPGARYCEFHAARAILERKADSRQREVLEPRVVQRPEKEERESTLVEVFRQRM